MPKNKHIYSVVCKPIHKSLNQFPTLFRWVSLLFIQVCVLLLAVPPHAFAGILDLSVTSANGDNIFRGNQDRLLISFTVDESPPPTGHAYSITAETASSKRLIKGGTVFKNQTVPFRWNGTVGGNLLPDGSYTIRVKVGDGDEDNDNNKAVDAVLDSTAPRISSISANADSALLLSDRGFIKVPLRSVTVTPDVDSGSPLDVSGNQTKIVIKNEQGATISGFLAYSSATTQLTLSLGNPLDTRSENGNYTLAITLADTAGNTSQSTRSFTFDNVPPNVTALATTSGPLTPGTGVNQQLDFVEVTFTDNLQNGINLSNSTLQLTGPAGEVLGRQTFPKKDTLRWEFLSPLSPRDGLHDGEYTMEIVGTDNAGNQTEAIVVPFVYDNLAPQLVSLSPTQGGQAFNQLGETIYHNQPLTQIVAAFNDGTSGTGVAYDRNREGGKKTTYLRFSRSEDGGASEELPGRAFLDTENTLLTLVLDKPIVSQDGHYILDVQSADVLGNTEQHTFQFLYDTQLPTLVSTIPAADETISDLSQIEIKLDEITSGIDFIQSTFRLLDGAAEEVSVNITSNGRDAATLTLLQPIALDGSDDGTYTIEVTPTDLAGNTGATARRQFYLVSPSHQPEVRLTMPDTSTVNDFTTIVAELINYIGAGIDFDASTLTVTDAQGTPMPQAEQEAGGQEDEANNLLTWRPEAVVARDGSADGEYTITATFIDFIGQRFTQAFPIVLDTQFPAIKSVQVATEAQTQLSVDSITDIAEIFTQITVAFDEAANDISFDGTTVSLAGPDGADIPLNRLDDGQNVLTLKEFSLTQGGEYVLSITPQDLAGNQSTVPFVYRFRIDVPLPTVSSVVIGGKSGALVYQNFDTNVSKPSIVATFADLSGVGIALAEGSSTIVVTNADGLTAPGMTTSNGTNQLTWTPIALPTDGSADGRYTVAVTPVDKAGRQGAVVYRQFVYDTQAPRITDATPVTLSQPVNYINGVLTQLQFTLEDDGPAGLALEEQTISLFGRRGERVATTLTADSQNGTAASAASTFYLTLSSPFAQDGSADGEYTVRLGIVDKAGNRLDSEYTFIYDSQVPRLSSVMANTEPALPSGGWELVPGEIADISASINRLTLAFEDATRVDFANTSLTLMGPDEAAIPLLLADNGTSTLTASFQALRQVGIYTLSVTAQDVAGNVASGAVRYQFALNIALPSVSAVLIGEQTGDVAQEAPIQYVNARNARISATLVDATGTGLLFGEGGSSIVVTNASGAAVPGQTSPNGTDGLIWEPVSLPTDGSADGRYTVAVTPVDKAGRQGDVVYRQFIYDTESPQLTSASPLTLNVPVSYVSGDVRQFMFTVEDVGPADVALEMVSSPQSGVNTLTQTIALRNATGSVVPATVTHSQNDTASTFYLTLSAPFAQDGSADGEYTVRLGIVDKAGNRLDSEHTFIYDSQVPLVSSVLLNTEPPVLLEQQRITLISAPSNKKPDFDNGKIGAETQLTKSTITLQFEEATRMDFANTTVALIGPGETEIPLNVSSDSLTQLTVRFVELTQDGLYTLSVTPQDIAGNVAQGAVRYSFLLDTEAPQLTSASPLTLNAPVSYLRGDVRQFVFTVEDVGPADVALEMVSSPQSGVNTLTQTIALLDATGSVVPATVTHQNVDTAVSTFYLTLSSAFAQDGSADGEYTVRLGIVDKAGNRLDSEHTFIYDSQVPRLSSVMANTEPALPSGGWELVPGEIADISASINRLTLAFEDATRVDFANTSLTLMGPDEAAIPLLLADNGMSMLTASFQALRQVGMYTLSVTAQDIAGNVASGAVNYRFVLDIPLPSVSAVLIGEQTGDVAVGAGLVPALQGQIQYVNARNVRINATFVDATGTGLLLGEGGSSIVVTNASGAAVPGQARPNGTDGLIWEPVSLPTDGSADGRYTVAVTPVDKAGRQGTVVYRQFIYDTESPQLTSASPLTLSAPVSYVSGDVRQFVFTVEDVGPADVALEMVSSPQSGVNTLTQTIALLDATGSVVPATVTHSQNDTASTFYLTLSSPFAQDGSADGEYTVRLGLVDKAGNRLDSEHTFIYDSQVPRISSVMVGTEQPVVLEPQRITEISESLSTITLQFEEETRIDFANTEVILMGPDASGGTDESGAPVESEIPLTLQDDGASQITVSFLELTQIGSYTLSVTPQDIAGNVASGAVNYRFVLDIPLPSVSSVIIGEQTGDVVYVNASNMHIAAILLDPTETGLAFGSEASRITVTEYGETTIVPGATGSNGTDLLVWEPRGLTSDGTTDGRYSVYVIPVDKAGRRGSTVYREFVYDTQAPEITSAELIDLSQPVSYISQSLTQLHFTVADAGPQGGQGAELDLEDQKVSLRDASGSLVPAQLTDDAETQLFLTLNQPLPLDGSMDGEYTVVVELSDKAGNTFNAEHLIVYDTQAPSLVSTVPADGALSTEDITQVQVNLSDEGGSGIDWTTTTVTLIGPGAAGENGSEISGELVSNGTTQLILNTNQLVEDGRYIIRVQAVDRAGNGNATVFERSFLLSRRLPAIVSTSPSTAPEDEAFTNEEIERIEVTLETDDENHLSTLRLLNAANQVIAGQQQRESDRLIYNLVRPLATDGSEDDTYTIEFTPISASGRQGAVQRLSFVYDTQAPEIEPDEAIHLVVAQPEVNNSLIEIRVNLTDNQSGIDWENLDEEWLTFERLSPDATEIAGRVDDDSQGNLTFRLTVPLADNGSADGEYRITVVPKDRAGNGDEPYQRVFTYDTSPPMIDASTLLINDAPLLVDINATDYPTAVATTGGVAIQANIFDTGLGVNLAQSRIVVRNSDGTEISGNTQQNGVDTLLFKSDGLTAQGLYQVTVISIGNDSELLGFAPTDSITTEFLYETTAPTATVTSDGGATELTDEALPLEGTAADPAGTVGDGQIQASGVWLVEIVGEGPDRQPIDPVPATDDSNAEEEPWSRWSVDFLPSRSGEYDLDVRVTDNAGNYAVYDIGEYTMSVSLTFRGATFGWPNPLRLSKGDVAFFSFDVNVPLGETVELTLSIYDWGGDIVLSQTYPDVVSGQRNDQLIKWNLENQAGTPVARGIYVFRLEAVNATGNSTSAVGKVLVVD